MSLIKEYFQEEALQLFSAFFIHCKYMRFLFLTIFIVIGSQDYFFFVALGTIL